jgi:hypothetical protein
MTSPVVVVVRLNNESDVMGILDSTHEEHVVLEYPFTVFVNGETNSVAMFPYCTLSDEKFYTFKKRDFKFLVTASSEVSNKFLKMVDSLEQEKIEYIIEESNTLDRIEAHIQNSIYIEGNNTKH